MLDAGSGRRRPDAVQAAGRCRRADAEAEDRPARQSGRRAGHHRRPCQSHTRRPALLLTTALYTGRTDVTESMVLTLDLEDLEVGGVAQW